MKIVQREIAWQRLEGLALFVAAVCLYGLGAHSWWWFAAGIFVVDVTMVGYLANNRIGAFVYNLGHSLTLPLVVYTIAIWQDSSLGAAIALIWLAHIGMDRAMGYGLKTDKGFKHTHLGEIGNNQNK